MKNYNSLPTCVLFVFFLVLQTIFVVATSFGYILTKSAPAHYKGSYVNNSDEEYIYFQGEHNELYKIKGDSKELFEGTWDDDHNLTDTPGNAIRLGGEIEIFSTPCVGADDWIYFQGKDNELFKIRIDGKDLTDLGVKTLSTPSVDVITTTAPDSPANTITQAYLYFQGEKNELCQLCSAGSTLTRLHVKTLSTPCVEHSSLGNSSYVYFQGTDNNLLKLTVSLVAHDDVAANQPVYLKAKTLSPPSLNRGLTISTLYFQGVDNELRSVDTNGESSTDLHYKTFSTPYVDNNGSVYFQGEDNKLYLLYNNASSLVNLYNQIKSTPSLSTGGWIYFQTLDNRLKAVRPK